MSAFTNPFNRMAEGMFSYSSCAEEDKYAWGEEYGKGRIKDLRYTGLVPYFTEYAHPNLPMAVCYLADHHDVKITCSATIMDEGNSYWSSGQVTGDDYCKIELVSSGLLLMPIGHLEQILCAGLAALYKIGAKTTADIEGNPKAHSRYIGPDDVELFFEFENQRVCLQMMRKSPHTGGVSIHLAAGSW